jgi:hypothetical protein
MKNIYENYHKVIVNPSSRPMIISNLHEAACSIKDVNDALTNNRLYSVGRFNLDMGHIYHHINFAWNIRGLRDINLYTEMSDENFKKWGQYPTESFYWQDEIK